MAKVEKIFWSHKERLAVFEHGLANYDPQVSAKDRWQQAQRAVLEPNRVRQEYDPHAVSAWNKAIKITLGVPLASYTRDTDSANIYLKLRELVDAQPVQQAPNEQQDGAVPPQAVPTVVEPVEQPKPAIPQAPSSLEVLFDGLVAHMLKSPQLKQFVLDTVSQAYDVAPAQIEAPAKENVVALVPRVRRPRVLIAGLKGHQMTEVSRGIAGLELVFWSSDKSLQDLKHRASRCDVAVGFVNFLSHSADGVLKARAPYYVPVAGGLDTLKAELAKLVPPELQRKPSGDK